MLKLSDFDYYLPKELIAQYPLKQRDAARLLVLDRAREKIEHRVFKEIGDYLHGDDLLVLNDTKVLSCRIKGYRPSGGKAELLLLNRKSGLTFNALIRPGRIKGGDKIIFNGGKISARVSAKNEVVFNAKDISTVYKLGVMPLPPYIKRETQGLDNIYYQTVYAKKEGAIASPTAGLHFTHSLLDGVRSLGAGVVYITLHVGYGTFKPVKAEDISRHKMEAEYFKISAKAAQAIERARFKKRRIFSVGTTTCRALETYALGRRQGYADLFMYPGYKFRIVDALITNFHLPRTTLFMLVCAFAGEKFIRKAYREAVDKKYRFYSYGDAMLII